MLHCGWKWKCLLLSHVQLSLTPWTIARLWNSPGKNTGVDWHLLLQGFLQTQGLNPGLLHCRQTLYCLSHHAAAAAASLQLCPTLCVPIDGSQPGFPSLGFSRQEHWSGLPFPSPMHESESEVAQCLSLGMVNFRGNNPIFHYQKERERHCMKKLWD